MDEKQSDCIFKRKFNKTISGDLNRSQNSCQKSRSSFKNRQIAVKIKQSSKQKQKKLHKSASCISHNLRQNSSNPKQKQNNLRFKTITHQNTTSLKNLKKQQIAKFSNKVRKSNKKYISRQNSKDNLQMRLPWGVDQPRLNNYVLQTLAKMQKLRKGHERSQQTFTTEKSRLKQSDIKLQFTPKKSVEHSFTKVPSKIKQKVVKSPTYQQKTYKKIKQKQPKQHTQGKPTQKNKKSESESEYQSEKYSQNKKNINLPQMLSKSLTNQFQCLQKNNLYSLNYRVVNRKIIQIQLAILKKAQSLFINLNKGSLICQSINQTYQNVSPKSSIILMTAISGFHKTDKYIYPQLQIILNEKNGNFGLQRKILIPYTWLFLLEIIPKGNLKQSKSSSSKIKNKSIIDNFLLNKQLLQKMQKIFQGNFIKTKIKDNLCYTYGFLLEKQNVLIKIITNGNKCMIQCESGIITHTNDILELIQYMVGI